MNKSNIVFTWTIFFNLLKNEENIFEFYFLLIYNISFDILLIYLCEIKKNVCFVCVYSTYVEVLCVHIV